VLVYVNAAPAARVTPAGGLVMPGNTPGRCAAELFTGSGLAAETVAGFRAAAWEKLLSNLTANPMTGRRAEVPRDPPVAALAMDLLREVVAVDTGPCGLPHKRRSASCGHVARKL
jgi:2-dehydropantoate 2-reductase